MLIDHNPDDWEVRTEHYTCPYHREHPEDRSWPGCTCHGSSAMVRKVPVDPDATSGTDGFPRVTRGPTDAVLKAQAARIEALEEWVRDSARHHCEAGVVLPDAHGEPHRDLCERARTLLSTTKEPDHGK